MLIIPCLYFVALWLVFSEFKIARWGWAFGTISVVILRFYPGDIPGAVQLSDAVRQSDGD